ncbi:MAG: NPCBM/NEW2 domain-containing protein [Actinomycetota bacterium]|nr:NPCBM/NEW2 domain-containing protein [Actinomycetota bacterium]
MTEAGGDAKPHWWRWQVVAPVAAIVAAAVLTPVIGSVVDDDDSGTGSTSTTARVEAPGSSGDVLPSTTATTAATAPTAGTLLGRELQPTSTETCRTPGFGEGSAWQVVGTRVGDRTFEHAYVCNLFSGGTGSLDFVLDKGYRELRMRIGFAADSGSVTHSVHFEVVADNGEYVAEPRTLRFGETADLVVDLTGRSRLKLRITETTKAGGSEAPSKPAWAGGVLTPA